MATITKVKNKKGVKFRAQVCVSGVRDSARFDTKPLAQDWAYQREKELQAGSDVITGKTLGDAFKRYASELPADRKGLRWDLVRLDKLGRDSIANILAVNLTVEHAEDYMQRALDSGLKPNSVIREFNLIKPVVRQMVRWKWISEYPWANLKMPKAGKRRKKLYTSAEIEAIREHSGVAKGLNTESRTYETGVAFLFATETGMRLNEICSIRDEWWNREQRYISLPANVTKTDEARDVPLSSKASEYLSLINPNSSGRIFTVRAGVASTMFARIRKAAQIYDGTFHDSRHYAVTQLAKKLQVLDLARAIGHSNIEELLTYYEPDAAKMATLLD